MPLLFEKGYEVIAVDVDKKLVNEASNYATDAICLDAIDEISLAKLSPKNRDLIISEYKKFKSNNNKNQKEQLKKFLGGR